ncbi:phytoene synthase [Bordetella pertussis]|uniref:Phytoene synthase n=4 Tax=Bordetella pertussis TaxID=520 RepID=Q7VYT8_BORPE|nr:presqualene diphosphate synthase HpnD [Bordetella pertussis]ETH39988.1 squalene synthase HpnD [Bordetella pertussis H918]ETH42392.1 squalene synthase HpnD [Bordetella pertussis H939]ETH47986.1 squalene synthase HpnD [Bordetella pertussis H921]ETH70921.1 squalene synthase HpnD [Bordetella pertussis STO1-CHLA-0011]ETH86905.1 squalene synthase HpnD [Bordetella pertussis STO1-CHOC-0018]ETH89268.1 squalene synthase HpnD [Bordetella pertussis STO1-CHOC-0019]ETH98806.1 squalene synthase HpnD [Bo
MTPDEYCQEKAAKSGSSFYYSFLFLPPARRRAITALYAFCREVDDVVDECSDPSLARVKLAWWRTQVDQMVDGKPDHPVTRALQPHLADCNITRERLLAVIDGMEMDLDQTRYLDWPGLRKYCWHVAGVVGELSAGVFGYQDARTLDYAGKLGLAFQLTNIIRDVGDDARRGRIYLPVNELQQFEVKAADILNGVHSERFSALMRFQAERTRGLYREAMQALPETDRRAQRPGLMMAAIYHALLDEIERDDWQVLHQRISLTPVRKLWLAWKTWVSGGAPLVRRLAR